MGQIVQQYDIDKTHKQYPRTVGEAVYIKPGRTPSKSASAEIDYIHLVMDSHSSRLDTIESEASHVVPLTDEEIYAAFGKEPLKQVETFNYTKL